MSMELVGASVWEAELYNHLTGHAAQEEHTIQRYRDLATESESRAFRFLADQIIEDEVRHHRWTAELAATIRSAWNMAEPPVPDLDLHRVEGEVLAATEELLRIERSDRSSLRHLIRELEDVRDTTLWALLVRLMLVETDKHIAILEFVRRHAGRP